MTDGNTEVRATDSNLRLDVSVLTDRAGDQTALMDKNELYIFEESVEARIGQYLIREQKMNDYYRAHVFAADTAPVDRELEYIKSHVFMQASSVSERMNPEKKESDGISIWLTAAILAAGILISAIYWNRKKKAREKRIADLDNRYDE